MLYNNEIKILICANQKNKIIFIVNKMIMCAMKSKCDERDTLKCMVKMKLLRYSLNDCLHNCLKKNHYLKDDKVEMYMYKEGNKSSKLPNGQILIF